MSNLRRLLHKAERQEKQHKTAQIVADQKAKRDIEIAANRANLKQLDKQIAAAQKALAAKVAARKDNEAKRGAAVIARVKRGGKAVEQLITALAENPDERMSKANVAGKGRYYRPVPANIVGQGYYYRRRKRPYRRKGKTIFQLMYQDRRRSARRRVYDRAYRSAYPEMDIEAEAVLAKFENLSRKRNSSDRSSGSDRSTPEMSPPRVAIKFEDLGNLLTYL